MRSKKRLQVPHAAPSPDKKEEKVREIVQEAERRVRARRALKAALQQLRGNKLIDIVPATLRRFGPDAAELLIERIRRNQELTEDEKSFLRDMEGKIEQVRRDIGCHC